jgi:hypothetical protein
LPNSAQFNYDLLFRWFIGLSVDDPVRIPTVFSKNRDRLLEVAIAAAFMDAVLNLPRVEALLSDEHFSVDGTLIQAWATLAQGSAKRSLVEWPEEGSMKSGEQAEPSGTGAGGFGQGSPQSENRRRATSIRPRTAEPNRARVVGSGT